MKVEIVRYCENYRQTWENLVTSSVNGTFLHSRAFFDHNALNAEDDHSFLFLKNGKAIGVIPACLYVKSGQVILHSHLRSTYGGFIVNEEVRLEESLEMVELLIDHAKKISVSEIIIRNPFRIFGKMLCDETDYAMWYRGFMIKYRELEIAVELKESDVLELKYADATRRSIKKGKKMVRIVESNDYATYWKILEANLEDKHAVKPTHSYEQFILLLQNVGQKKIKLFAAMLDQVMIAGIIVFIANEVAVHAQYIASDAKYQNLRPLNVVVDHINLWGSEKKFKYFNLGTANEQGGTIINHGLFRFKEGFGGRGVLRETMHLII